MSADLKLQMSQRNSNPAITLERLNETPLVSVLLINHNYGAFIASAIESVLRQTYQRFELIICDDGSTDASLQVIHRYVATDNRIQLIAKPNGGQASALNASFTRSSGQIVCLLDADDTFAEDKLASIVEAFFDENTGLVLHAMTVIDRLGKRVMKLPAFSRLEAGWLARKIQQRGGRWQFLPASALSFRRELGWLAFPIPEQAFRMDADAFVYLLLPLFTRVTAIDRQLACYRVHGASYGDNIVRAGHLDQASIHKDIDRRRRVVGGANQRLLELGMAEWTLDLAKNLNYLESEFYLRLFERRTAYPDLLRDFLRVARATVKDDLYSVARKAALLWIYGVSMALPPGLRVAFLSRALAVALSRSRGKEAIRKVWSRFPSGRPMVREREAIK